MHCKSDWIRFLNRSATHPVRLISRELGDFLQSYYFFEKMSRASQYPILGNGCVRMRFQKAGQGLVQWGPVDPLREDAVDLM
jgi:hypothetical protein